MRGRGGLQVCKACKPHVSCMERCRGSAVRLRISAGQHCREPCIQLLCCALACCAVLRRTPGQTLPSERPRRAVCLFLQDGAPEAATGADASLVCCASSLCPRQAGWPAKAGGPSLPTVCTTAAPWHPAVLRAASPGCCCWHGRTFHTSSVSPPSSTVFQVRASTVPLQDTVHHWAVSVTVCCCWQLGRGQTL